MALSEKWTTCSRCGKKPPEVTEFRYGEEVLCCRCWPIEESERTKESIIQGTIEGIFDLRGRAAVRLLLDDGTVWASDVEAFPASPAEIRRLIGRRIRLTAKMEILDQAAHESLER